MSVNDLNLSFFAESKRYKKQRKTIHIMKKLVGLTAIVILFSLTITAQAKKERIRKGSAFTTEQQATLQSKKLALSLDLDANQQKSVAKLMKAQADNRKKMRDQFQQNKQDGVKLTNDEKFELQNNRLEKQLEHKAAMKKILNDEQFEKWSKISKVQKRKGRENMKNKRTASKKKSKGQKGGQRDGQRDGQSAKQYKNRN